jgi:hypothetical protein
MRVNDIKNAPQTKEDREVAAKLVSEIKRGEILVRLADEPGLEDLRAEAEKLLHYHYETLLRALRAIVESMNYPTEVRLWDDTEPLAVLNEMLPGLYETRWWNLMMQRVIDG